MVERYVLDKNFNISYKAGKEGDMKCDICDYSGKDVNFLVYVPLCPRCIGKNLDGFIKSIMPVLSCQRRNEIASGIKLVDPERRV